MNWSAISAVGQIVGAVAVLITLLYLARQVRQSNRQDLLNAFRHTYDAVNDWSVAVFDSEEISDIVLRGRKSYDELSDTERFRFEHVYRVLLNNIESHYHQVQQVAPDDEYREWALATLASFIHGHLNYPGVQQLWENVKVFYETALQDLVAKNMGDA